MSTNPNATTLKLPATLLQAQAQSVADGLVDVLGKVLRPGSLAVIDASDLSHFDSSALAVILACRRAVLAKGANATNTSVEGLAQALSYAAPVANSLGLSLETTVAIIGKFADAGIDASRAGTALNSILSQFSNPASKYREELAAAGITTSNFEAALHQLAAAGPAGSKAILAVGQEAGPALRALLNQGMGALDELKTRLDSAAGSAAAQISIEAMQVRFADRTERVGASVVMVNPDGVRRQHPPPRRGNAVPQPTGKGAIRQYGRLDADLSANWRSG